MRAGTRTVDQHHPNVASTTWVHHNLERPESFGPALHSVTRVLLMARPVDEQPQRTSVPLIEAMKRAGVVNVTTMGSDLRPDFGLRKVELALEAYGASSSGNWCSAGGCCEPIARPPGTNVTTPVTQGAYHVPTSHLSFM